MSATEPSVTHAAPRSSARPDTTALGGTATGHDPESQRLALGREWKAWGPYLSERQWGTVREDYSPDGTAWEYFPHDHARSRAYRWGEDGLGGFADYRARMCLSVALWNGRDPILKERLYGLTNTEGNHGEDVKELYYYLDATPTSSYLRMLYKYPQSEFPYERLLEESRRRGQHDREFELIDTGLFDDDRYFDVEIEYCKAAPEDILMRVTAHNRGADPAEIHLLPHAWFRNTWSWSHDAPRPLLALAAPGLARAEHPELGEWRIEFDGAPELYFCENETNAARLFGNTDAHGYWKDGIDARVVRGEASAVNPDGVGTKLAAHHRLTVPAGGSSSVRVRLRRPGTAGGFTAFDATFRDRRAEADRFYDGLQERISDADARNVQRQALAGMIWSQQYYGYDVHRWLQGDEAQPSPPPRRQQGRNRDWDHLFNADVLSMPDAWEYPWYAAWDLAFHCLPLALVDTEFAKRQLILLTREWYMHPNGQVPAYEWAFGDVNPPVHAWAAWRVFQIDRKQRGGEGDRPFLERVFHKLLLNFTWWVNRKDAEGNNVFQGGFLGLDNIGIFDRSAPLPTGGHIDQADGTAWMAMYSLDMMRIALELALHNPVYEDIASKFFEHFLHIAEAMSQVGGAGLWDDDDRFFYDCLHLPGDRRVPLRVRSMVGLIPLFAVEVLEPELLERLPGFRRRLEWLLAHRPDLHALVSHWEVEGGVGHRRLLSLLRGSRMKALIQRLVDETEFLSPYGVRALSRAHLEQPFRFEHGGEEFTVRYTPGESDSGVFGGNSNWRGPIWFPMNFLIIESLQRFHHYYGDEFRVECPAGSGNFVTILEVADEISARLQRLFLLDAEGGRPCFGEHPKFRDPHFRDHVLFYEYFHGDDGRGVGASHQTGWTGLIAKLIQPRRG
jgi:hypothetical protein